MRTIASARLGMARAPRITASRVYGEGSVAGFSLIDATVELVVAWCRRDRSHMAQASSLDNKNNQTKKKVAFT